MSVDYAILERGRLQAQKKLPANERFMALGRRDSSRSSPRCNRARSSACSEGQPLDKEAYRRGLAKICK